MQDTHATRQPESNRERDASTQQQPSGKQEPLQRAIDPRRLPFYAQLLGHRSPAGLRLSSSPQPTGKPPVQRQEAENMQREPSPYIEQHGPVPVEEQSPVQRREALRTQLWGDGILPWLRLSPAPRMQQEQKPLEEVGQPLQRKENTTGLPDSLKAGVERLSGLSLDDVQVHYHSSKPAEVQALAYTQGTEIHVGPGQEQHLAHETWHVVQQKQGRVEPTLQAKGIAINDDQGLEREADMMGEQVRQTQSVAMQQVSSHRSLPYSARGMSATIQRVTWERTVNSIWSPDLGRAYEVKMGANIAGNYPIIDDFRKETGIATSYKAMDLINNYQGPNGPKNLLDMLNFHLNQLINFRTQTPSVSTGITIDRKDVRQLVLKIAIPNNCDQNLFNIVAQFATLRVPPVGIAINIARQYNTRNRGVAADAAVTTTLSIVIDSRDDLPWGKSAGTLYEEREGANIAGNFPVIDDFQLTTGVATSLKTINVVENYPSVKELTTAVNGYIQNLAAFAGNKWPLGTNHKAIDQKLVQTDLDGTQWIVISESDIKQRVLKIAIPQIRGKKVYDFSGKPLEWDSDEAKNVSEKYDYIKSLHGLTTTNGVSVIVEGVE